ncbi:recombination directionality factor [Dechloromonas hortensis]|uniref:recombination directionality factor n=1 Tax=Dechloromonas hortensis TaxID=337779 RepID=UPI000CC518AB|nr:hydrolase or metal-binding protein [Dechloromonas hortensis]PKO89364.1 MAG: hydrolase or metal-binding protein [Betaproteobacteria bacterium HGW-Betaproteobacteria-12]
MLKGLAITPPVLGRISIGKIVEKAGKRLPEKDDQFTITSQVQNKDGWLVHPLDEGLRKEQGGKIRSIPIRLLFNDPDLNFRAEYNLFDRNTGRPLCVGNGCTCKRQSEEGIKSLPCPSPDGCSLAKGGACKPYGRLNVALADDDPLGSFVFRTTGFNSIRTLAARLQYFQAISGDRLSCLPLELRLRGKSTRQSHGTPIYYVDITPRTGMVTEEMLAVAQKLDEARREAGFDQYALDAAARQGLGNGVFEESEEGDATLMEEFYPEEIGMGQPEETSVPANLSLADKLAAKAATLLEGK